MIKIGEFKIYKGMKITRIGKNEWSVNGTRITFNSYEEAKKDIDYSIAEEKALEDIEENNRRMYEYSRYGG